MGNKYARNILYIIPTKNWGTKERFAFRDILLAQKYGYNVYLCTNEDSYIAQLAIKSGIDIIAFKEHFLNRFSSFHKHFPINKYLKNIKIDLVHCYDFRLLFSLSFQLKTENLTALVITQDHVIDKPLQHFWYKPLISRIDSLILVNKNLKNDSIGNLALPQKKIEYFGVGLSNEDESPEIAKNINFDLYKNYFLAGTFVSPSLESEQSLRPLLSSLKVLNAKNPGGTKSKLVFISVIEFQKLEFLPDLMEFIQQEQLEDDILFVAAQNAGEVIPHLDLWISTTSNELVEDFAIKALLAEVPVILPRNFCSTGIFEDFEGVGETYKLLDARELKDKWEKAILGNAVYRDKARLYRFFLEREHSFKNYRTSLLGLYSRVVLRRGRLFREK